MSGEQAKDQNESAPPPADQVERQEAEKQAQAAREAMDRLNEANRVLVEARMLPRGTNLTQEQIDQVIGRFQKFTSGYGITVEQASRECGYSKSALSEWQAHKYKANQNSITHAVNECLEREGRRLQARQPKDYVNTDVAESIRSIAYLADKRIMMAAIVVPAGAGKTKVLKILAEEMQGIYINCNKEWGVRDLYREIAMALGWSKETGTRGQLYRFIIAKLTGTARVIFLDEAHQMGAKISCVRGIYDEARVPVIMAGTAEILERINDTANGCGQFSSRCIKFNAVDKYQNAEGPDRSEPGRDLFTLEEIRRFFAMKKIRLDRDALEMLWAVACLPSHGTLRTVEHTVETALDINPEIAIVTREHVLIAMRMLMGAQSGFIQRLAGRHIELSETTPAITAKAG